MAKSIFCGVKPYIDRKQELSIQQGCVLWGARVIIPRVLRQQIINIIHEGHIGISKMKAMSRSFVYWPKIDSDLEEEGRTCVQCQLHGNRPRSERDHPDAQIRADARERDQSGCPQLSHGKDYTVILQRIS